MLISFYVHLLPGHAAALPRVRTTTVWPMNTTDQRALWNPGQTQRNATALTSSALPTQTEQARTSDRHGNAEHVGYGGGTGGSCPSTQIGAITDIVGSVSDIGGTNGLVTSIADADNRVGA
jgi:hypothetical protein